MKRVLFRFILVMGLIIAAAPAYATTFYLDYTFSGDDPDGDPAWLTAELTDNPDPAGGVLLTLTTNLTGSEYVGSWYFNLNPDLNPTLLSFAPQSGNPYAAGIVDTGVDAFKADGDGWFDILFSFPTAEADRFPGDGPVSISWLITSTEEITPDSFSFGSTGHAEYFTAAHIQSILIPGGTTSGWIAGNADPPTAAPIPGTAFLLGSGILSLVGWRRIRKS